MRTSFSISLLLWAVWTSHSIQARHTPGFIPKTLQQKVDCKVHGPTAFVLHRLQQTIQSGEHRTLKIIPENFPSWFQQLLTKTEISRQAISPVRLLQVLTSEITPSNGAPDWIRRRSKVIDVLTPGEIRDLVAFSTPFTFEEYKQFPGMRLLEHVVRHASREEEMPSIIGFLEILRHFPSDGYENRELQELSRRAPRGIQRVLQAFAAQVVLHRERTSEIIFPLLLLDRELDNVFFRYRWAMPKAAMEKYFHPAILSSAEVLCGKFDVDPESHLGKWAHEIVRLGKEQPSTSNYDRLLSRLLFIEDPARYNFGQLESRLFRREKNGDATRRFWKIVGHLADRDALKESIYPESYTRLPPDWTEVAPFLDPKGIMSTKERVHWTTIAQRAGNCDHGHWNSFDELCDKLYSSKTNWRFTFDVLNIAYDGGVDTRSALVELQNYRNALNLHSQRVLYSKLEREISESLFHLKKFDHTTFPLPTDFFDSHCSRTGILNHSVEKLYSVCPLVPYNEKEPDLSPAWRNMGIKASSNQRWCSIDNFENWKGSGGLSDLSPTCLWRLAQHLPTPAYLFSREELGLRDLDSSAQKTLLKIISQYPDALPGIDAAHGLEAASVLTNLDKALSPSLTESKRFTFLTEPYLERLNILRTIRKDKLPRSQLGVYSAFEGMFDVYPETKHWVEKKTETDPRIPLFSSILKAHPQPVVRLFYPYHTSDADMFSSLNSKGLLQIFARYDLTQLKRIQADIQKRIEHYQDRENPNGIQRQLSEMNDFLSGLIGLPLKKATSTRIHGLGVVLKTNWVNERRALEKDIQYLQSQFRLRSEFSLKKSQPEVEFDSRAVKAALTRRSPDEWFDLLGAEIRGDRISSAAAIALANSIHDKGDWLLPLHLRSQGQNVVINLGKNSSEIARTLRAIESGPLGVAWHELSFIDNFDSSSTNALFLRLTTERLSGRTLERLASYPR